MVVHQQNVMDVHDNQSHFFNDITLAWLLGNIKQDIFHTSCHVCIAGKKDQFY